jgi:hypothetical protein
MSGSGLRDSLACGGNMKKVFRFVCAGAVGAVMMVGLAGEATTVQAGECNVPQPLDMFPLAALFCVRVYDLPDRHCCGQSYHVKNSTLHERKRHEQKLIEGKRCAC